MGGFDPVIKTMRIRFVNNPIQRVLEAYNVKLGLVISDVFGLSGRNLLERLVDQGSVDTAIALNIVFIEI